MQFRVCSMCKESKELCSDNYHLDKKRKYGYMYNCKVCEKKRGRERYLKNPRPYRYDMLSDEQKAARLVISRKYGRTIVGRAMFALKSYQTIDKKKNLESNLTKQFIIEALNSNCVYCGFPATGLDRKYNNIGHTKENCVPSCKECNVGRMDNFSYEEMLELGKAVKEIKMKRILKAV